MVGRPIAFADGATLIDFSNYYIPRPFVLARYEPVIRPIVRLPGGALLDVQEGSDLPSPQLMPFVMNVVMPDATWNTTLETWRTYQGRYGTLSARLTNSVGVQTVAAYFDTVNLMRHWLDGALVQLAFTPVGDWA